MELGDSIGSVEVSGGFPRVFADAVALPLDEVVESATHNSAIKDTLDFELFMIIDDLRCRRGSRATTRERIGRHESKLYDREDGVVTAHGEGEFEPVCTMTYTRCDFEGPETLMI